MRLIFIATGDIALPSFRHLLKHGPKPLAVVTQPDKPVGRKQEFVPPRIKTEALEAGIPVYQPEKIGDAYDELCAFSPEVIVVMAYGQILRQKILDLSSQAIINLHASLLPKYRGAACIQAAIDAGDQESGITSMHVVRELDAGDMILAKSLVLAVDETGGTLHDRLADLAAQVLEETLLQLSEGTASRVPQDPAASSYIGKLEREDGRLDWSMSAVALERRIRAYDPWPGTYTIALEGGSAKRLKVFPPCEVVDRKLAQCSLSCEQGRLIVGTGCGALEIKWIQPEGGKRMSAQDYLRGRKPQRFESA